ncbi:sulfate permease [Dolichospermum compactum NIES-806]|uniref:Sulfate permease n=2 Tax=Dolichospermum compactum TaxID=136073 RepID=A0A1Z4V680_9CYAN|nr:sulfate permease [Dolichospermum compactum NIES-806]
MPHLLIAILFLQDWVKQMPMAALVAVMIMVSIGTFRWSSIKNILTLKEGQSLTCQAMHERLSKKLQEIEDNIRQLQKSEDADPNHECVILEKVE